MTKIRGVKNPKKSGFFFFVASYQTKSPQTTLPIVSCLLLAQIYAILSIFRVFTNFSRYTTPSKLRFDRKENRETSKKIIENPHFFANHVFWSFLLGYTINTYSDQSIILFEAFLNYFVTDFTHIGREFIKIRCF